LARSENPVSRRTRLLIFAGALVVVFAVVAGLWQISRSRCFVLVGTVTCRVETTEPTVALTFDDGPTATGVAQILPQLERHGARATFFLTGREAALRPDLVREIVAAGHEIGNHSFSHRRMVLRGPAFYAQEIQQTQDALHGAGSAVRNFRPPYGKKLIGLPRAVEDAGLRLVMWDVEDPQTSDPAVFASDVVDRARPGSIILIHAMYPSNSTARSALPAILSGLKRKGLQVVSVEELLERHGGGRSVRAGSSERAE
jgi:peptidoglycan-N-acetylglucosamine deacetylase